MNDLHAIKLVDAINSTPVHDEIISGVRRVTLRLFALAEKVSEVTVNGLLVGGFTASGMYGLVVELPDSLLERPLAELEFQILSSDQTGVAGSYELLFDIGRISRKASGTNYLIQKWLRYLLSSSGTDCFDISAGAGLLDLAGVVSPNNLQLIKAQASKICHDCKSQIMARQRHRSSALPSELLRDAWITGVGIDMSGKLVIRVVLLDARGKTVDAAMKV